MLITEIYRKYQILPNLQLHHFRVTAVAKLIAQNSTIELDIDSIIRACLLHDMGNIVKFNLGLFPENLQPQGLLYWQAVKDDLIARYGKDEHLVALSIAKEVGVSSRVLQLIQAVNFASSEIIAEGDDLAQKICLYSDQRVSPYGVLPLVDRIRQGRERFRRNKPELAKNEKAGAYENLVNQLLIIERQIFDDNRIKPSGITDQTIVNLIPELMLVEF
jgi:hypothetical protein